MFYIVNGWDIVSQDKYGSRACYEKEGVAKAIMKRKYLAKHPEAMVVDTEYYHSSEPMVERTNLMSGNKFMIAVSEVGGVLDPSTERYWAA